MGEAFADAAVPPPTPYEIMRRWNLIFLLGAGETQQSHNRRDKGGLEVRNHLFGKKDGCQDGRVFLLGSIPLDSPAPLANTASEQSPGGLAMLLHLKKYC